MAQVGLADHAGTGSFKLGASLALAPAGECLVCLAGPARVGLSLRLVATALVSRLVPVLAAARILFRPVPRTLRVDPAFHFRPHAVRLCITAAGQRSVAAQAPACRGNLLAFIQGFQPLGPAFLKRSGLVSRNCRPANRIRPVFTFVVGNA